MSHKQSIQSTALEKNVSLHKDGTIAVIVQIIIRYGLLILGVLLTILFSLIAETFASILTLQAILSDKSILAILALAATLVMIVGKIDLNVGFGVVLWHIMAISLQVNNGWSSEWVIVFVLLCALLYGYINGVLVAFADIDAFVATLGSGTVLYGVALWYSGGRQIVGELPERFYNIYGAQFFSIPIGAFYVLALAVLLWLITSHTTIGRKMYAVGANPVAAELNGIGTKRYVVGAFMASSFLTALASILLASQLGVGQANVGSDFLLPALVGAFLGSTTIQPGRVNVWGTMVAIAVLSVGIAGLQQFGSAFFIEPLFNGMTLLLAITLAGYAKYRKISGKK